MNTVAIIPARGGSKGIPHKNIVPCAGKPLLAWTIEAALAANSVSQVIVSSDDQAILDCAVAAGALAFRRSDRLAQDDTPTEPVIQEVLQSLTEEPAAVVLLQATSPVRTGQQIDEAVAMIERGWDSVLSVVPSHAFLWWQTAGRGHPNYDPDRRPRRQDMQQFQENGSIYVTTLRQWQRSKNRIGGRIGLYVMPEESALQIDTPLDLYLVEKILERLYGLPWTTGSSTTSTTLFVR